MGRDGRVRCPFCGGTGVEVVEVAFRPRWQARCGACGARGPEALTQALARRAWAMRARPAPEPVQPALFGEGD